MSRVVLRPDCKAQSTARRADRARANTSVIWAGGPADHACGAASARPRDRSRLDNLLVCLSFSRPSRFSCLAAEGMAHPPVSPDYVPMRIRIAAPAATFAPSGTRTQQADRSVDRTTGRRARCSRRDMGQSGASRSLGLLSGSSFAANLAATR
jgi:hypothetical protein